MKTALFYALMALCLVGCNLERNLQQTAVYEPVVSAVQTDSDSTAIITMGNQPSGIETVEPITESTDFYTEAPVASIVKEEEEAIIETPKAIKSEHTTTKSIFDYKIQSPDRVVNTNAIIGFILSIFPVIPIIGNIVGIVFCITAINEINNNPDTYSGKGLATFGLILNILSMVVLTVVILFALGILVFNQTP